MIDWRGYTGAWAAILVLVGTVSSPAQTGTTEGLVLRVYDVAEEMTRLCELAGQQTPNVHKIVPFVEFRDPALVGQTLYQNELGDLELQDVTVSFDIDETFTAFLDAEIEVPVAGDYGFRLTSDDGSQLFIDGELAVDHDGLHALSSREATVSLTEGLHALHLVVFQNLNQSGLILEWLPPSADDWEVLPQDAFLTENDFILATAPGTKSVDCSGITSGPGGPGDGKPLEGVHPSYDLIDISRTYTSPQIGGMDFLPDGRLLVTDWNDNDGNANLWVIEGAKTTRDGLDVRRNQFAGGFQTSLGLLAWWDFDEGSGTASGAGWTSGVSGSALEFDGDDQVSVPSAALNLGSEFTISAWIRSPVRCNSDKVVIAKGPAAEGGFEMLLDEHNELRFRAAEVGDIASGMVIPQNRWTHVAASYNGALMRFFQGGTLFALKTVGGSLSDESEVIGIGANAAEAARYFEGQLDEVVVHDRALSSGEVEELSAGSPSSLIPEDGLVAYWSFQEGCGTSVGDHSGNRHHGTLTGATWQPGILDRSLLFDGSADRIFLGDSTINPAGTFTIACWVRSEDVAFFGEQVLLEKDAAESFADFKFYLENGVPRLSASGYDGNFAGDFVVPSDGNWHHVAVSYDGVDMEFYLDGVFRRVHTPVWGVLNGQAGPTAIGARPTSSAGWFRGSIDEMAVYNRALTGSEMTALFDAQQSFPAGGEISVDTATLDFGAQGVSSGP